MAKKKTAPKKKNKLLPWTPLPEHSLMNWIGQWIVASIVLEAWKKMNKVPKEIRLREECIEEQPDGSGLIHYECKF